MDLKQYFSENKDSGVLATADAHGKVNVAVYARPHVQDDNTVSFIMRDRLSHRNLQSNPHAAFMYLEEGTEHHGIRLYLTRTGEESDPEKISAMRRRTTPDRHPEEDKFLVTFHVDKVLAAVGTEDPT
ncbi:MAG: pyridoxamine 5'-phosphate oxidase family protein [Phycisphaerae bacterium]|nr:pyridoxamine 5'-phosphate oxidase family protein [Phycisphaerae bacterium]